MSTIDEWNAMNLFCQIRGFHGSKEKCESPDFIIETTVGKIGIEFTELLNSSEFSSDKNPAELYSFQDKVINESKNLFEQKYKTKLAVTVEFNPYPKVNFKEVKQASVFLLDLIQHHFQELEKSKSIIIECSDNLFKSVTAFVLPIEMQSVWSPLRFKMTEVMPSESLQDIVSRKSKTITLYRSKANKIFLVIVTGLGMKSLFYQVEPDIKINSEFDDVFVLDMMTEKLVSVNATNK
ncbi:MAG: hypothetical protein JSU09_13235 [Bacteroidetes bacterium]|nr:hypothetical protein [Bacteroidota bacterium]